MQRDAPITDSKNKQVRCPICSERVKAKNGVYIKGKWYNRKCLQKVFERLIGGKN